MFVKLLSRLSWIILFLSAGATVMMTGVLVLTTGGINVLALRPVGVVTAIAPSGSTPDTTSSVASYAVPVPTQAALLNSVIVKRPLFQTVPLPDEVSRTPEVVGSNLFFAILITLSFGAVGLALYDLRRDKESRFSKQWQALTETSIFKTVGRGNFFVQRGCLGLPIILIMFALYGIVFAFLEKGTDIYSPQGIQLALILAMSVGLVSLGGDIAQRWVSRVWRSDTRYGLYPTHILVAVITTLLSRSITLSPGIMYGVPGGSDAVAPASQKRIREVALAFTTLMTVLVLGALGWGSTALIALWGRDVYTPQALEFLGPLARLGQTIGLAIFTVALQTAFYEMIPVASTIGGKLFKWNGVVWGVTFMPVVFAFAHLLLNPSNDFLTAFQTANVRALMVLLSLLMVSIFAVWGYFNILDPLLHPDRDIPSPFDTPLDAMELTVQGNAVQSNTFPVQTTPAYVPASMTSTRPSISHEELNPSSQTAIRDTREIPKVNIEPGVDIVNDTKPSKPVSTVPNAGYTSAPTDDTHPKRPAGFTRSQPKRQSAYPDPTDPYAGLFPPPKPGDEDYFESNFAEGDTPPSGMKAAQLPRSPETQEPPTGETTDDVLPPPPDNLPL